MSRVNVGVMKNLLFRMYAIRKIRLRSLIIRIVLRIENGEYYSPTLRRIFEMYHQVSVGLYSHGGCFQPGHFDRYTEIGRYCSIAASAYAFNRNHPMQRRSMHGFFFNETLGWVGPGYDRYTPLTIGHDVWIGHNAIIMPNVRSIGTGAVIGAGAVVNKDVPPYAVVVGNPGRVVRFRFSPELIEELLESRWWEKSMEEVSGELEFFTKDLEESQYVTGDGKM